MGAKHRKSGGRPRQENFTGRSFLFRLLRMLAPTLNRLSSSEAARETPETKWLRVEAALTHAPDRLRRNGFMEIQVHAIDEHREDARSNPLEVSA